ncbi:acetyl-CoA carboxylase biotin carboxylase subunit family protein [Phycisphaerales bacterium AB-hyl4]|uniref:Acetyl-CoA carboxylase biotin carboxylase subunit family protein n=1 Tax=Natronomicrosphaera hydrolytica TaxID=3242702 RepID=A0ABV4U2U7_9BACT
MNNVFVIGLDPLNHRCLQRLPYASNCHFHQLLTFEQLQQGAKVPVESLIREATDRLDRFTGTIDAILSFWDFPGTLLAPILARRFGCASPSLEATLRCEHKYWSRCEQSKATDACPRFEAVNPFDNCAFEKLTLATPYWIKPVKSFLGQLSYRVNDEHDFNIAVASIRDKLPRLAEPFNHILAMVELPPEIAAVDGRHCIAEASVQGWQATLEGFLHAGRLHSHGIVDSICYPGTSVFHRLQYPSRLPEPVQRRVEAIVEAVLRQIGFEDWPVNVEFFWDAVTDRLWLLEINPRVSQSHAILFEQVDGVANFHVLVELALRRLPEMPQQLGRAACAAKFSLRAFHDGVVCHVPSAEDCLRVEHLFPGAVVELMVRPGDRLSTLLSQDSYSYLLAEITLSAPDEAQLLERYEQSVRMLPFGIGEVGQPTRIREWPHENRRAPAA